MPDRRRHRSAAPGDPELFAPEVVPVLAEAVAHLSWLRTRGYAERSSLKLVGDRFDLRERQRSAVLRATATDTECDGRRARRISWSELVERGGRLAIDGYNLLTTLECALGGAVLVRCRDGCLRDLAGLHGTWRRVAETLPALACVGELLEARGATDCAWLLDRPVSNSGRLSAMLAELADERGWRWSVTLEADPDARLVASADPIVTADRLVLDGCVAWLDLAGEVVRERIPGAWIVDLGEPREPGTTGG